MARTLFVGNLAPDVTAEQLERTFAPFGSVRSAEIILDSGTRTPKRVRLRRGGLRVRGRTGDDRPQRASFGRSTAGGSDVVSINAGEMFEAAMVLLDRP